MKKSILAISLIGAIGLTSANYTIMVPLEQGNGGTLPSGSINISPMSQTEEWLPVTPYFTDWVNATAPYDCTNWSPDPSGVTIGLTYTQIATDCSQDQTRTRQEREQETTTLAYRDVGAPIIENQVITRVETRDAIGAMESWMAATPTYTSWVNSGVIYGCTNWNPNPNTINSGEPFTQTATDCKQDQTRNRQNREQETTTLAIRNDGSVIVESQTLTNQSNTRPATGTKPIIECRGSDANNMWYVKNYFSPGSLFGNWDGVTVFSENITNPWSVVSRTAGAYIYTRSTLISGPGNGAGYGALGTYYICREPL